jgi:hypothetical protein
MVRVVVPHFRTYTLSHLPSAGDLTTSTSPLYTHIKLEDFKVYNWPPSKFQHTSILYYVFSQSGTSNPIYSHWSFYPEEVCRQVERLVRRKVLLRIPSFALAVDTNLGGSAVNGFLLPMLLSYLSESAIWFVAVDRTSEFIFKTSAAPRATGFLAVAWDSGLLLVNAYTAACRKWGRRLGVQVANRLWVVVGLALGCELVWVACRMEHIYMSILSSHFKSSENSRPSSRSFARKRCLIRVTSACR